MALRDDVNRKALAFEIAFSKAAVLMAKYQNTEFQGEMSDLVDAFKEARKLGRRPTQPSQTEQMVDRALGMDSAAERKEKMANINNVLSLIRKQQQGGFHDGE